METTPVSNKFELFNLNDPKEFEPVISEQTMLLHHGKHLATYVGNLNAMLPGTEWEGLTLEEIVRRAPEGPILNNAGQILNHNMFFEQLANPADDCDSLELVSEIERQFNDFKDEFTKAGLSLFGSGWVWLSVDDNGKLVITQEPNAANPLRRGLHPLLTVDVWEHASYVDYQNRRAEFLENTWDIIDWRVPTQRYLDALKK